MVRGSGASRALFASLLVDSRRLDAKNVVWLENAYAELMSQSGLDGVALWLANFQVSGVRYELTRRLVYGIQGRTGKPVLVGGMKGLWPAGLANGFGAVCTGPGRTGLDVLPRDPEEDDEAEIKRRTNVFHRPVLHTFGLTARGPEQERGSFLQFGCECQHHTPHIAPQGERERISHNTSEAMRVARAYADGEAADASARLSAEIARANECRDKLDLKRLGRAWTLAGTQTELPGQASGRQIS